MNGQDMKQPNVTEKRVFRLDAELKKVQDAQIRSAEVAIESGKRAIDAAAQLAGSVLRISDVDQNAKSATEKLLICKNK